MVFPLTPSAVAGHFNLWRPIYRSTAALGHFGRPDLPWEQTPLATPLATFINAGRAA